MVGKVSQVRRQIFCHFLVVLREISAYCEPETNFSDVNNTLHYFKCKVAQALEVPESLALPEKKSQTRTKFVENHDPNENLTNNVVLLFFFLFF